MKNEVANLWESFSRWFQTAPSGVERESVFLCICPDGSGWVGDGTGAIYAEFDTPIEGIEQLAAGRVFLGGFKLLRRH